MRARGRSSPKLPYFPDWNINDDVVCLHKKVRQIFRLHYILIRDRVKYMAEGTACKSCRLLKTHPAWQDVFHRHIGMTQLQRMRLRCQRMLMLQEFFLAETHFQRAFIYTPLSHGLTQGPKFEWGRASPGAAWELLGEIRTFSRFPIS